MTDRLIQEDLPGSDSETQRGKSGRKTAGSSKSKTKNNIVYYTKQLISIGHLIRGIAGNLQKEIKDL
jgi:hypothetical protein